MLNATKNKIYMEMAILMSAMSKCVSKQVACLLVKDNRIISTGINGTPEGYINCCDKNMDSSPDPSIHREWSDIHEIHAEQNAIIRAAKDGISINNTVAYCTLKPCIHCTKLLIGVGVKKIYYRYTYDRYNNGENKVHDYFLMDNNVTIEKC